MKMNPSDTTAVITLLAETWPATFSVYERRRRPLAVGIHEAITVVLGSAIAPEELRSALRAYVGNAVYLSRLTAGTTRVGLDGAPAGVVSPREATFAAMRLASRKRRQTAPVSAQSSLVEGIPVPVPPPAWQPDGISFNDIGCRIETT
jgi:sRNA-binding protein